MLKTIKFFSNNREVPLIPFYIPADQYCFLTNVKGCIKRFSLTNENRKRVIGQTAPIKFNTEFNLLHITESASSFAKNITNSKQEIDRNLCIESIYLKWEYVEGKRNNYGFITKNKRTEVFLFKIPETKPIVFKDHETEKDISVLNTTIEINFNDLKTKFNLNGKLNRKTGVMCVKCLDVNDFGLEGLGFNIKGSRINFVTN